MAEKDNSTDIPPPKKKLKDEKSPPIITRKTSSTKSVVSTNTKSKKPKLIFQSSIAVASSPAPRDNTVSPHHSSASDNLETDRAPAKKLADPSPHKKSADPSSAKKLGDPSPHKKSADPSSAKKLADPSPHKKLADPSSAKKLADPSPSKKSADPSPSKKLAATMSSTSFFDTPTKKLVFSSTSTTEKPLLSTAAATTQSGDTFDGYVHDVVETKKSQTPFLTFTLQVESELYRRCITFVPNQFKDTLEKASDEGKPIRIQHTNYVQSKYSGDQDIKLDKRSTVQLQSAPLSFERISPNEIISTLEDAVSKPTNTKVNVKITVIEEDDDIDNRYTNNGYMALQTKFIADHTHVVKLTCWGSHMESLQLHRSYHVTNLSIKTFNGMTHMSTTFNTTIKSIPALPEHKTLNDVDQFRRTTLRVQILAIEIDRQQSCIYCKQLSTYLPSSTTIKCAQCNKTQRTQWMTPVFTGNGTFLNLENNNQLRLVFKKQALQQIVAAIPIEDSSLTSDDMESFLINCDQQFLIEVDDESKIWSFGNTD